MQEWRAGSSGDGNWFIKVGEMAEGRCTVLVGEETNVRELRVSSSDCSYFLIDKAKSDLGLKEQMRGGCVGNLRKEQCRIFHWKSNRMAGTYLHSFMVCQH